MEDVDEKDMVLDGDGSDSDNNSIPTTMGVRASYMEFGIRTRPTPHRRDSNEFYASNDNISVAGNISSLFIPVPIPASSQAEKSTTSTDRSQQMQMNIEKGDSDDDISTLTEHSMEDQEDDNLSQTTANTTWTCVTDATTSTTAAAPTASRRNNFGVAARRRILAKRNRVNESQESSNPVLFRDNKNYGGSDQWKRRRKA